MEFKRHATLLGLHKARKHHRSEKKEIKKGKNKNHTALLKFLIIMQMPFYSILSRPLFPLWPYALWLMLGLQKKPLLITARPHANTPIWGSGSLPRTPSSADHRMQAGGSHRVEMWSNVTADLCKSPSEPQMATLASDRGSGIIRLPGVETCTLTSSRGTLY